MSKSTATRRAPAAPARKAANPDSYTRRLRAIHAACRNNGLDDDARHALIFALAGKTSLAQCTALEMNRILDHLNRASGYAGKAAFEGRARVTPAAARAPLLTKIDALLAELHRVTGEPHTLKYADAIARRNGWGECIDFCNVAGLHRVVGALSRTLASKQRAGWAA
jgi:phage gp16-like protein